MAAYEKLEMFYKLENMEMFFALKMNQKNIIFILQVFQMWICTLKLFWIYWDIPPSVPVVLYSNFVLLKDSVELYQLKFFLFF